MTKTRQQFNPDALVATHTDAVARGRASDGYRWVRSVRDGIRDARRRMRDDDATNGEWSWFHWRRAGDDVFATDDDVPKETDDEGRRMVWKT